MISASGGQPLNTSSDITAAIETFLACGLSPRQILQLAGLCREAHDAPDDYAEVRVIYRDRRLKHFQKLFGVLPEK